MKSTAIHSTTQQFLDIYDVTNDLVIMKDGAVSMLLTVDAMNFGLLAEEEQDAVMYAYAGLLNSLNYPIQVVISSHTKDVTNYLELLKSQEEQAGQGIMRQRIGAYRKFVANLIRERNVLDKKFYVSVPATGLELGFISAKSFVPGQQSNFDITSIEKNVIVEKAHNLLEPRRDHLIAQFARIGLFAKQLSTQEIIQLFYISYNPEAAEGQMIADSNNYTSPLVTASIEKDFMLNATTNPQGVTTPPTPSEAGTTPPTPATPTTPTPTTNAPPPTPVAPVVNPFDKPTTPATPPVPAGQPLPPIPPANPPAGLPPTPPSPTPSISPTPGLDPVSPPPTPTSVATPPNAGIPPLATNPGITTPPQPNALPTNNPGAPVVDLAQLEINQAVGGVSSPTPSPTNPPITPITPITPPTAGAGVAIPPIPTTEPLGEKVDVVKNKPENKLGEKSKDKVGPSSPPPIPEL